MANPLERKVKLKKTANATKMNLKNCVIKLDDSSNTYYAGQTISGLVKIHLDTVTTLRGIIAIFLGEAITEWREDRHYNERSGMETTYEVRYFSGREQYFKKQFYLMGAKKNRETEVAPGTYTFPISCELPVTLPTSFEGEYGYIRYTIKIVMERSWVINPEHKMAFTVLEHINLNAISRCKEPYTLKLQKSFCCLCCRSRPISITTKLLQTGYVSGQTVPITCKVENDSNMRLNAVKFEFRKNVLFQTTRPRTQKRISNVILAQASTESIEPREYRTFQRQIAIPRALPPNITNCKIIKLDYVLQVEVLVSGPHRKLMGTIPITLGTVPLIEKNRRASTERQSSVAPGTRESSHIHPVGWNLANGAGGAIYQNIEPPQFVESEYRTETITDRNDSEYTHVLGDGGFAPRYPTFKFTESP